MAHRDWENPETMMGVDEVLERVLAAVEPMPATRSGLLEARGLVLAEDIVAPTDVPPFRNSAMDGFAVHSSAPAPDQIIAFNLIGTIAAGSDADLSLRPGEAARIMTGAPVPEGADAVIRFEEVDESSSGTIRINRVIQSGENVREAGEDIRAGAKILSRGTVLGAPVIGALAALNFESVLVHRRPKIGILSTGDEVVDIGPALRPGQIRNANSYILSAMVEELGADPVRLGIAADTRSDLQERISAARDCDLIVTSGGVSHGDFDLVKDVLRQEGQIDVWTVRIKPGKPLAFGTIGGVPLLGLPGNPAAATVSLDQFGRPAILKMLGFREYRLPTVRARLTEAVENRGQRRHFERGVLWNEDGEWRVRTTGIHGSAMISSLTAANCYIVIPEDWSEAPAGTIVEVQVLDNPARKTSTMDDGPQVPQSD
ncbi:hypothetical protein BH23CHL2_BH23CHL2_28800 [soil metagenome]